MKNLSILIHADLPPVLSATFEHGNESYTVSAPTPELLTKSIEAVGASFRGSTDKKDAGEWTCFGASVQDETAPHEGLDLSSTDAGFRECAMYAARLSVE